MKLLFTKSEYRTLIDMIYMAEWMIAAFAEEPDPAKARYQHLVQKIYSHAKEMGWESLVEPSTATNEYSPSLEYETKSGIHDLIDEYDDDSFWDQLVDRLTERDVRAKVGTEQYEQLSFQGFYALADPISEVYEREFEVNGLDRLRVEAG